jgi:hypothetical protein
MGTTRKKRLKQRDEKQARWSARRVELLNRTLDCLGIRSLFDRLPGSVIDMFLDKLGPAIEVKVVGDPREDPALGRFQRAITASIRQTVWATIDGREVELAFEDLFRGHEWVIAGIRFFVSTLRDARHPRAKAVHEIMVEAEKIVDAQDPEWVQTAYHEVSDLLLDMMIQTFRIQDRILAVRLVSDWKPEGPPGLHIEVKIHDAESRVVSYRGSQWTAFPCRRPRGLSGMRQTRWNCRELGIEGPNVDLPVYISWHALKRLHERLPLYGHLGYLNVLMVDSLDRPVFIPQDVDEYLVETRMGGKRVGYFVAKVFPHLILIKTFLFLTMNGTPEGKALRSKLGLSREKIEQYKLDDFFTLVGSDIVTDPFWSKIMNECGCGHLIHYLNDDSKYRAPWAERYGEQLKAEFDLREAIGGYKIGQKWVRWNEPSPAAPCGA